jgi:sortase A
MPRRVLSKAVPKKTKARKTLSTILIILGALLILLSLGPFIQQEIFFYIGELKNQDFTLAPSEQTVEDSPFARLISTKQIKLDPVDTDFGLVIERLGINVPVVKDVSVSDTDAYMAALEHGVAHAMVTGYPSRKPGNVYIFAHASLNFWRLGKYATVFNLLRHLTPGDLIHVFYQGETFVYRVVNVERYKGWNTYPLTRKVLEPLLTLQTCDPPGTTLNRLVVTAKLVEVR